MKDKIIKILGKVRPYIQMHGGDAKLESIEDGIVTIKVSGKCVDCSLADLTYNKVIGTVLREEIPDIKNIIFKNLRSNKK
jgi:Fe-S cluster biogenesis protein NfuA